MIMERVMVIGCCDAEKSTFSKRLSIITELEVVHLDQYSKLPIVKKTIIKPQNKIHSNTFDKQTQTNQPKQVFICN